MTGEAFFQRSIMMYGQEGYATLQGCLVAVVGLGGVGSYAAEALVRAGIGRLRIIDCDVIKATDVNRQLMALAANVNQPKAAVAAERLRAINPDLLLDARQAFFHADTAAELIGPELDFVIDAIDSLNPKGELIRHCTQAGIPMISILGASARTDPFQIRLSRLEETAVCPLARALRRHLRARGIPTDIPVLYSTEPPREALAPQAAPGLSEGALVRGRPRQALPSLSTLPGIFGLMAANHVILTLLGKRGGDAGATHPPA